MYNSLYLLIPYHTHIHTPVVTRIQPLWIQPLSSNSKSHPPQSSPYTLWNLPKIRFLADTSWLLGRVQRSRENVIKWRPISFLLARQCIWNLELVANILKIGLCLMKTQCRGPQTNLESAAILCLGSCWQRWPGCGLWFCRERRSAISPILTSP